MQLMWIVKHIFPPELPFGPPFASITASTLLGRLSTRCWNIADGTCFHSATRALERGRAMALGDLRSGLCACQSSSYTPKNHFCMDLALCTGEFYWNGKGFSPNCCHKVGSTESPRMSLYAVALRFSFNGTKGSSQNHEKPLQAIIPPPNCTVGPMHWGR